MENQSRDTASAARTCLFLLAIFAVIGLIVCVVVALGLIDVLPEPDEPPADQRGTVTTSDSLLFSVLDVGQGACVVVITPDGRTLVADSGRSSTRTEEYIVPYLRDHGVERIDYLVATNPDQDHIGGMPRLLELIDVGTWVDPVVPTTNQTYARSLELVDEQGIDVLMARAGGTLDLGPDVSARILWPVDPLIMDGSEPSHNDNSVVIQITHGDVKFIIPGDIEAEAEEALVARDQDESLQSDVLVTAHHGSRTSSTAEFLDAVSPSVAIIPVGFENQYGHPHDEVIQRLRFRSIRTYRTDLDGTIEVRSDGDQYQVTALGTEDAQ
jgi:competence protein ComEC